jgi:copper chaperone CopZ
MMTHTYTISGMTCGSCELKVKTALIGIPFITDVTISRADHTATISMDKHVSLPELQKELDPKYTISEAEKPVATSTWIQTYKPVLLIFLYIVIVSLSIGIASGMFNWSHWMQSFMAGFFLVFSFFKLLNLKGFADSYRMYDIVAKRIPAWGYIYAFIELGLGLAFVLNYYPVWVNAITLLVMSVSMIGVLQSVFNKRQIQCACLGSVFNLPMSTITIIEDGLMIAMSAVMLVYMS